MAVFKWVGMFFLLWVIGSVFAVVIELVLNFLGGTLGQYGSGFVVLLTIIIGLILYGTRNSHSKPTTFLESLYLFIGFASTASWIIGALLIYGWTLLLSYQYYGLFGAIIAFVTPVLSQLFWMYQTGIEYGFLNGYNLLILLVLALKWGGGLLVTLIGTKLEKRTESI